MRPFFIALSLFVLPVAAGKDQFNYDESQVPEYQLPDPLVRLDGSVVSMSDQWAERREEIFELFAEHVYGRTPEVAEKLRLTPEEGLVIPDFLDGRATLKEVALSAGEFTMNLLVVIPNEREGPVPAILGLNFRGNHSLHPDPRISLSDAWMPTSKNGLSEGNRATEKARGASADRWAIEKVIDRGFALATIYCGDIDPDFDDGFANGIHQVIGKPRAGEWGSIGTWAWGLSRGLDQLVGDPAVDGSKVAVFGHSRLGKTALWAAACDPRFALAISNESGCGGAALSRRCYGETVKRINTSFPHWFCDRFASYNDNEPALPVDQHMLIALMAPRPVYIASAVGDRWADPKGEFLAGKHAGPVYALFGQNGIESEEQPPLGVSVGDWVGYHIREGKHNVTDDDWERYLEFSKRHFGKPRESGSDKEK